MEKETLSVGNQTFDMGFAVPMEKQNWRKRLVLVSSIPHRLVGLVTVDGALRGEFTLYHTMIYISNLVFHPVVGPGGVQNLQAKTQPQALIPYDLLTPITLRVCQYEHYAYIHEQSVELQEFFFNEYQQQFAERRITTPGASRIVTP